MKRSADPAKRNAKRAYKEPVMGPRNFKRGEVRLFLLEIELRFAGGPVERNLSTDIPSYIVLRNIYICKI